MVKTMVRQAGPLQPMEINSGKDIHLQPMEDPTPEQVDTPEGGCVSMEIPCWSRLVAEPVVLWKEVPILDQLHIDVVRTYEDQSSKFGHLKWHLTEEFYLPSKSSLDFDPKSTHSTPKFHILELVPGINLKIQLLEQDSFKKQ
ncbi:hypothetical protein llap_10086 [Limosa lapponica baueri]|uniref:Uncharacterized protein n=1 Tax=Limosa lapponica baueri TaxID=1758121 RepID=A0A2I0U0P1_LIMLA|nr:hypothetical protein llap_10086 [Limosa lapponica baueri]